MMSSRDLDRKLEAIADSLMSDGDMTPLLNYIPDDIKREIVEAWEEDDLS